MQPWSEYCQKILLSRTSAPTPNIWTVALQNIWTNLLKLSSVVGSTAAVHVTSVCRPSTAHCSTSAAPHVPSPHVTSSGSHSPVGHPPGSTSAEAPAAMEPSSEDRWWRWWWHVATWVTIKTANARWYWYWKGKIYLNYKCNLFTLTDSKSAQWRAQLVQKFCFSPKKDPYILWSFHGAGSHLCLHVGPAHHLYWIGS